MYSAWRPWETLSTNTYRNMSYKMRDHTTWSHEFKDELLISNSPWTQHTGCTGGTGCRQLQMRYSQSALFLCSSRNRVKPLKLNVNQRVMFSLYYTLHLMKKTWEGNLLAMPGRIILHIWRQKKTCSELICLGGIHRSVTIIYMLLYWWPDGGVRTETLLIKRTWWTVCTILCFDPSSLSLRLYKYNCLEIAT